MRPILLLLVSLLLYCGSAFAQAPIVYTLDLGNIHHHELGVTATFPALPPQPLRLRMPTASPGRYAEHNFAKNVYDVTATDAAGQALTVQRTGLNEWAIAGHGGSATVRYTLYANRADGTYSKVDNRKLHLNMPATFAYGVGLDDRPVELHLPADQQPDWQVATQLQAIGQRRFRAPDYYYFYDSPTMVGDIRFREWTVAGPGRVDTIQMAFLCPDPDSLLDQFAAWTEAIVEQQRRVFGELPAFDYGRYTFLCAYNPYVSGDGMEHRNSTVCSAPVGLTGFAERLIGTISHEFFHCWNVERIRPASLEPFDFDRANLSGELWFAEGFTSYFDDLSLLRAGILAPEDYVAGLTGGLNYALLRPGRDHRGPIGMSQCAPFVDAASSIDPNNFANTFISYYTYGSVLGLTLDLLLRRDHGTDLNAYMALVWQRYGRPEVPYHIPDLQLALADLTDDAAFAESFFARSIYGSELPDLASLLADFGVQVAVAEPDQAGFYGLSLTDSDTGVRVSGTIYENNPLYAAGLESGDLILGLAGQEVATVDDFEALRGSLELGKSYPITFRQNGIETTGTFTAAVDPTLTVSWDPEADAEAAARRGAWLGPAH
jgi:predicted metalloprotease with PDZ domain